jgi:hypothetical protein
MTTGPFLTQGSVKIAGSQTHQKTAGKPTPNLAAARATGHKRNAAGSVLFLYLSQSLPDLGQYLVPADRSQLTVFSFERLLKPLSVMLVVRHFKPFAARISL